MQLVQRDPCGTGEGGDAAGEAFAAGAVGLVDVGDDDVAVAGGGEAGGGGGGGQRGAFVGVQRVGGDGVAEAAISGMAAGL